MSSVKIETINEMLLLQGAIIKELLPHMPLESAQHVAGDIIHRVMTSKVADETYRTAYQMLKDAHGN